MGHESLRQIVPLGSCHVVFHACWVIESGIVKHVICRSSSGIGIHFDEIFMRSWWIAASLPIVYS